MYIMCNVSHHQSSEIITLKSTSLMLLHALKNAKTSPKNCTRNSKYYVK